MKIEIIFTVFFVLFVYVGCAQKDNTIGEDTFRNELANESSPYLLQHANNPVNWYPWGEQALSLAREQNKLIIISIGYSSCHWCHVMEHESFEDTVVARVMNDNYVSIKIDREERPDIDQIYIEVAQIMTGRAGWPLNVITLPDRTPVFAGTYFPKDQWMRILESIQDMYSKNPRRLLDQAKKVMDNLERYNSINEEATGLLSMKDLAQSIELWKRSMDRKNGGIQSQNKFPLPGALQELMDFGVIHGDKEAMEIVEFTLDKMALGGIYDHVGGGFHRYTVEPTWKIPHFEKMLYDNGQLLSLYASAYQVFEKDLYRSVVEKTARFIDEEMTSEEGGFFSSYDADSEGEEGKFYVWSKSEIDDILVEHAESFSDYFNITEKGNWEDQKNIVYASVPPKTYFQEKGAMPLEQMLDKLYVLRSARIKPGLDDKILTSWNALMMLGYIDAYRALEDDKYLQVALGNAEFLVGSQMQEDGRLFRSHKDGRASINGFLDDYAFTIRALINLYQVTFDQRWLNYSLTLTEYAIQHFYNSDMGLFRYTSDLNEALIVDKYVTGDNVIPSGNSVMAMNLYILGNLFYVEKKSYLESSSRMIAQVSGEVKASPIYHYGWVPVINHELNGFYEIAIVGNSHDLRRQEMQRFYIPDALYLGGSTEEGLPLLENKFMEGETYIYVCRDKYCKLPVKEAEKAISLIERDVR